MFEADAGEMIVQSGASKSGAWRARSSVHLGRKGGSSGELFVIVISVVSFIVLEISSTFCTLFPSRKVGRRSKIQSLKAS